MAAKTVRAHAAGANCMNAPWFKFFAGDYLNDPDVDKLSLEAQGILVRMWAALWMDGSLPGDVEEMARKCKVRLAPMQMHMQSLMHLFVQQRDGTWISERMERERQRSGIVSKVRHNAAKKRWNKGVAANASAQPDANAPAKGDPNGDAKRMQSEVRGQMPDAGSEKKEHISSKPDGFDRHEDGAPLALVAPEQESRRTAPTDEQINALYKLYPRKIAPIDAKKAIRRAVSQVMKGDPDHPAMRLTDALDFLAGRLQLYARCVQGRDPEFLPYPATWHNEGHFWDDESTWKVERSGGKKPSNGFHHDGDDSKYEKGADYAFRNE
jgi:uncharacterized protein YdaU (DUF1376 family)